MDSGGLGHLVVVHAGTRRLVKRTGFVKEADLQSLILSSPELLGPLGSELRFIPIGWEVSVGPGKLDLLFLDSEGVLTLIETKLKANDESRREVVGQILEYAAFAAEWTIDAVTLAAGEFLASSHAPADLVGQSLEEAIATRFDWLADEEDERQAKTDALMAKLESSMKGGRLRIVCGVDERIENLERLVRYLSAHSDLQVVLLQVNRFPVDGDMSVLVPTLHGDVDGGPGRAQGSRNLKLTVASLIESFAEGTDRDVVSHLVRAAADAGASFEPGPNGMSIRARTPAQRPPVTVAWIFAPGKYGWMRTRDISFGHGLDYPKTPPELREVVEGYYQELMNRGVGADASSKGVHARWVTPAQAAERLHDLTGHGRRRGSSHPRHPVGED
jgi:hypothetical protein